MPGEAWILLGLLLAVNIYCRLQAERRRVDEEGQPVEFRWWSLRLHPSRSYPTILGSHYRNLAVVSSLLFMLGAVWFMLRAHGG